VLAAVSATGVAGPRWAFEGFLPRSGRERRERLATIAADPRGAVLFEAPGRVGSTLRDLAAVCGAERAGAVCRELTKVHEQIVRATLGEMAAALDRGEIPARGEFVLDVGMGQAAGPLRDDASPAAALEAALARVDQLVADGSARGEAARRVATETGIPRRRLYRASGV
jgi:16S rRNA (cytidine1402-2'-O)-methyltransferase